MTNMVDYIKVKRAHEPNHFETWLIDSIEPYKAPDDAPDYMKHRASAGWVIVKGKITNSITRNRIMGHSKTVENPDTDLHSMMPSEFAFDGATYRTVAM